jgi:hypothetical protein
MRQILLLIIAGVVVAGCSTGYTVTLEQMGANVVATGSGAMNLTGLQYVGGSGNKPVINASDASISTGGTAATLTTGPSSAVDTYFGATGPANFGPGGLRWPDSASGDPVGVFGNGFGRNEVIIMVPPGYMSGNLSSSAPWNNVT